MKDHKQKSLGTFLIFLTLTTALLSAFVSLVPKTLAVQMTDDPVVQNTLAIIQRNTNVHVVRYNSLEYSMLIGRTANPVIWVSHDSIFCTTCGYKR